MRRLFISGANSFLGGHLLAYLAREELFSQVIGLTRREMALSLGQAMTYEAFFDLTDSFSSEDVLMHLAFARSSESQDLMASIRILEKLSNFAVSKELNFLHISSQSIYDPYRSLPARETDLPAPQSLYGLAKYYCEAYLNDLSAKEGLRVIHLRLASLIGPGLDTRITTRLLKEAVEKGEMQLSGDQSFFSYLHVEDAARMVASIGVQFEEANSRTYNVGSREYYSLKDMADTISEVVLEKGLPPPKVILTDAKGPPYNNRIHLDLMEKDFQVEARVSLKEAVKQDFERLFE